MIREHSDIAGQMLLFAHAVEQGSLSAAARDLDLSPSAVSKQIRRLEDHLGVRLLNRSTRRISMTDEGRAFYDRCSRVASEVAEAESMVSAMGTRVQGTLRVVATVAFAKAQLLPLIPEFMKSYPDLKMELELTDRTVDFVEENVDVAIRFSEQLNDPGMVVRSLGPNRRVICAAPSYLSLNGVPSCPEDLLAHNCLRVSTVQSWNDWEFDCGDGRRVLHVGGRFEANSADAIYHATLAGLGIARLSTYLVARDLAEGRLVRVLPEYTHEKSELVAIYPQRRNLTPRVRVFVDFLLAAMKPVAPWERDK